MSFIPFNMRIIVSAIIKAKKPLSSKRESLVREEDTSGCYVQIFTCMSMSGNSAPLLDETSKRLSLVSHARCTWLVEISLMFLFAVRRIPNDLLLFLCSSRHLFLLGITQSPGKAYLVPMSVWSGQSKTRHIVTFSISPDKQENRNKNETQSSWISVAPLVLRITWFFFEKLFKICFLLM